MANPVQRDLLVEVAFGADVTADASSWSWTDVSADLLSQSIGITRGRADEASETAPMATSLTLDNLSGDYTPDNPVGAYYPNVKRGTPLRITAPGGESYFLIGDPQAATVSTPDTAVLDITGDIDIRVELVDAKDDLLQRDIISKYVTAGSRSWRLIYFNGNVYLTWSANGTAVLEATATIGIDLNSRSAVRVTLDVNNGAGGWTATFYQAPGIDGPWEQVGAPVTGVGTTSIFNSTAPLVVGDGSSANTFIGKIWAAQVYNGIGGSLVADADFRDLDPATTAFTDSVGRTWTVGGGGQITDLSTRFVGQVDDWSPSWPVGDVTGEQPPHSVCDLTASSVRRRLLQGRKQLLGPIQRYTLAQPDTVAYWPMEDGTDATSIASGLPGGKPMTISGSPRLATNDAIFFASGPLPELALAAFTGAVGTYTGTGTTHARTLLYVPPGGAANNGIIMSLTTTGTAARWELVYTTASSGSLSMRAYDADGAQILDSGAPFVVNGKPLLAIVELVQNGANVDWKIVTIGYTVVAGLIHAGTLNSRTVGVVRSVAVNPGQLLDEVIVGHLTLATSIPSPTPTDALRGYVGELAEDRFVRLCTEENVPQGVVGGLRDATEAMGVQLPGTLLELLQQCADSDAGILLDHPDLPGLLFRPRATLYRQEPQLVLDAAVNGIANPFTPVLDDQSIRNDITVNRIGGSSARATDQASIDDEGLYDDAVDLSLATDAQTVGQAAWRLALGNVAGMRYSTITVDFDTAPTDYLRTWLSDLVDVGDLIRIKNLPRQHAPDDVDLIIQGYSETITPSRWKVTFNCSPSSPYRVGIYDGTSTRESRYASGNTTLAENLDTTETSIDITTPTAPYWTTSAGQYPFDVIVGGERITVGGCTGAGPAQTFTGCTRSVNGVVKTHTTGDVIDLFTPTYYAL